MVDQEQHTQGCEKLAVGMAATQKQAKKWEKGLGEFIERSKTDEDTNSLTVREMIREKRMHKAIMHHNLLDEATVTKVRSECYEQSVKMSKLAGRSKVWVPDPMHTIAF